MFFSLHLSFRALYNNSRMHVTMLNVALALSNFIKFENIARLLLI